ncbi:MAG: MFS transporter [Alphaproteobacteria bacterium]|nr:MFS transporter [Alphaproteobacteria bacterium]
MLLTGAAILLLGNGLFGTLLGVRANLENFGLTEIGMIMAAYFLGYVVGSFVCARTVHQVGHIRTLAAVSAILAATAIAHAIFVDPVVWGVLRLVTGFCIVGFFLVIESWLNSLAPPTVRGRVFSLYMLVNLLAIAIGQFLLAVADARDFVLFGLVTILFSLSLVPTALTQVDAPPPQDAGGLGLARLYEASPVGVLGCLTCGLVTGSFWGLGAVFGSKLALSQIGIASFMSAVILGGAVAQWPIGSISDRIDRRKVIVSVAAVGSGAAFLTLVVSTHSFVALLGTAALLGASMFSLYSLSVARTHDVLGQENVLAATRGLVLVFGIGAVIGPLTTGVIMDSFGAVWMFGWYGLIFVLFAGFSLYRMRRGEIVPPADQSTFVPLLRTSQEAIEIAEARNLPTDTGGD